MRIKILYILLLNLLCFSSYAQQQNFIDSLQSKLVNANDSQKIGIYNGLSWAYKYSDPHLAYGYGEKDYKLSTELRNLIGQAISLNRMGAAKLKLGELNASLKHMLEAAVICEDNNQKRILVTSLRQIGEVYEAQGNNPEAMKYYYNALSIADSINRPIGIALSALKVAGLYIKIENLKPAKQYLEYSIKEFKKDSFVRGLHQAYLLKGDYYYRQNLQDSALICYNIGLHYLDKLEDKHGYATTIAKIAHVWEMKGLFKKAIAGYNEALDIFTNLNDKKETVHTYVVLAQAYTRAIKYKKGIYYGQIALEQAKNLGLSNEEKEANYVLFSIFKQTNNQAKAIFYLEDYMHLLDSLKHGEESWRVNQMRKSFDLEIQVKENKLNTAIINNQALTIKNNTLLRNFLIVLISIVLVLATIIWYAFRRAKYANEQLLLANEEKNEAIGLISHDLKSPFNKIQGLSHILELQLKNQDKEITNLLFNINMVTHDGLALVQNLVDIKALTSGSYAIKSESFEVNGFLNNRVQGFKQLALSKSIELKFEPLDTPCSIFSDANSIARIFDNILSNAIKFSPVNETVLIECAINENNFSFSISDNGKGIEQEEIKAIFGKYKTGMATPTANELSNGLGLAIVSSLINKLAGSIDCISKVDKGATFIVSLPLDKTS